MPREIDVEVGLPIIQTDTIRKVSIDGNPLPIVNKGVDIPIVGQSNDGAMSSAQLARLLASVKYKGTVATKQELPDYADVCDMYLVGEDQTKPMTQYICVEHSPVRWIAVGVQGGSGGEGVQSDWNEEDSSSPAYILNKPTDLGDFNNNAGYAKRSDVDDEMDRATEVENTIISKIPSTASPTNQLATQSFVNSTVSSLSATFRGNFETYADLMAYTGEKTNNDYAIVNQDETHDGQRWRYTYVVSSGVGYWDAQYKVNDAPFTDAQERAINSGITSDLVGQISSNRTSILSLEQNKVSKDGNKVLSDNNYTNSEKQKLSGIETGAEKNVQSDWGESDEGKDSFVKGRTHYDDLVYIGETTASGDGVFDVHLQLMRPIVYIEMYDFAIDFDGSLFNTVGKGFSDDHTQGAAGWSNVPITEAGTCSVNYSNGDFHFSGGGNPSYWSGKNVKLYARVKKQIDNKFVKIDNSSIVEGDDGKLKVSFPPPVPQVASDWNLDGETHNNGVLNRTHYTYLEEEQLQDVNQTVTFIGIDEHSESFNVEIVSGKSYNLTIGEYSFQNIIATSNNSLIIVDWGEQNPYFEYLAISQNNDGEKEFVWVNGALDGDVEVVITHGEMVTKYSKLDDNFINDTIARTSAMAEKADKIPSAVNGNLVSSDAYGNIKDSGVNVNEIVKSDELADVATSGSYDDLKDKPSIPTKTSDIINDSNFVSDANYVHSDNNYTTQEKGKLAGVQDGAEVNVRSNWDEGDSSSDAFIQNRTHYGHVSSSVIIEEQIFTPIADDMYFEEITLTNPIEAGKKYSVTVNETTHELVAQFVYLEGVSLVMISYGDLGEDAQDGSFGIVYSESQGVAMFEGKFSAQTVTVSALWSGIIADKTLDDEYLSSNIARMGHIDGIMTSMDIFQAAISKVKGDVNDLESDVLSVKTSINTINGKIPSSASTQDKLVTSSQMAEAIQSNANQPVLANQDFTTPFDVQSADYKQLIGGTATCLETGPWFKMIDGVVYECGSSTGVYVAANDTTVVLNDESKFYFYAHGIKYQRIKTGSGWGEINLPDGTHTSLLQTMFRGKASLYFYDDTETVHSDKRVIFVAYFEMMPSKTNAVMEFIVEQNVTIDQIPSSEDPEHTYNLIFPSAKYICSVPQTETSNPIWALVYTINDIEFTYEQMESLNSGATASKIMQIESNRTAIAALQTSDANKVSKSGDTMTGDLNMELGAAIRLGSFNIDRMSSSATWLGGSIGFFSGLTALFRVNSQRALFSLSDVYAGNVIDNNHRFQTLSDVSALLASYLPLAGGTLTGDLTVGTNSIRYVVDGNGYAIKKLGSELVMCVTSNNVDTPAFKIDSNGNVIALGNLYKNTNESVATNSYVDTQDALSLKKASNLSDVANRQTAVNNITNSTSASEGQVLTRDNSGNASFKTHYSCIITDYTV